MIALAAALLLQAAPPSPAPPAELTQRVAAAHAMVQQLGKTFSDSVWPGFRPDTIPVLYVAPDVGTLLFGWRGDLPAGYAPVGGIPGAGWQPVAERGAASFGTTLVGRPTAQVVVRPESNVADLTGLTAHEAFHVFERASARDGRFFGAGENSFLVSSYPVFDVANEAGVALEGQLLKGALAARDASRRRDLMRQFSAARASRQRKLTPEFVGFEQLGEMNEGLAEYALVRTLLLASRDERLAWRADAQRVVDRSAGRLDSLTRNVTLSIRLRFYLTGPAQGRLLDDVAGASWKDRLMRDNVTLQEMVADVSGANDAERVALDRAKAALGMPALMTQAAADVKRLREIRRAQIDSLLAIPGVQLVIALDSMPGHRVGLCMIDPQNLLQADDGVIIHTRAVRMCSGQSLDAFFTTPAVHDHRGNGSVSAVIGLPDSVKVTSAGQPLEVADGQAVTAAADVRIETPTLTLKSAKADIERHGRQLVLRPRP